ncbi:MAG: HAMP domain-containing histidine kinase [Verrucomicrobia bacterium]|nr:HAMP domain-containing histidine kinase [Verrucomicrobiota bacterium]
MSPASRRIFLYWLLLLVPTLVVGGVAIQLLRREQARLAEQGAYAQESRRAAVAARVRLIAENVELLVGDVQAGLLDTVAEQPARGLDGFLEQWEKNNPLVRTAFRCTVDGRLLRPAANTIDQDSGGFVRRFSRHLGEAKPWAAPKTEPQGMPGKVQQSAQPAEPLERKEVASNVAQVQSARRDVQELVKTREYPSLASVAEPRKLVAPGRQIEAAASGARLADERVTEADRMAAASPAPERGAAVATSFGEVSRARGQAPPAAAAPGPRVKDAVPERRGWMSSVVEGRLHLLGWVQPDGAGEIRGFELELTALISRLAGALPVEIGSGEGYALRDDQGRVLHQVGAVPRTGEAAARVPLAAALLPGWDVVGHLALAPSKSAEGTGFFWVSGLLVAIFVAAILAGGSLLLWQARRSEAEAAQKTSFVANVSHEFKTPLTTIRLYAELLEQGRVRDAAQGGDYLRTIGRETQRLARLVNNALDFSRLEQGRKKYAREPFDLAAELARLLDTHGPRLAEAGMTLRRELPAGALPVTADRDALEQIVLNLLDNAAKYAADGREVAVALTPRPGGGAEVRVADRGPGVPPEHRERIFEKFHRVDDALTAEKTGAGLGLSIARQLARGLGGGLRYAPRSGGGAEFILELP